MEQNELENILNYFNNSTWDELYESSWYLKLKEIYEYDDYIDILKNLFNLCRYIDPRCWNQIKSDWRDIQNIMPYINGRSAKICPEYGKILFQKFENHLKSHNLSRIDYILMLNNLTEVPKCANPECNNKVVMYDYRIGTFCSLKCRDIVSTGKSPINPWKYWDYNELIKLGYEVTEDECIKHNDSLYHNNLNMAINHLIPTKSGWHSYSEELLGDILFLLNIYYEREVVYHHESFSNNSHSYRVDYYLPDYNVILECDGMFKWYYNDKNELCLRDYYINRKHEIQSATGIKVINILSDDIYYYNKNKKDLLKLITRIDYPLMKLSN